MARSRIMMLVRPQPARSAATQWLLPVGLLAAVTAACDRNQSQPSVASADSIPDAPPYTATLSRFDVPLDYDFTPILAEVERVVPKTLGSMAERHQMGDDP